MKKLNYFLIGAAGLLLASCAQDDLGVNTGNPDGTAKVSLNLTTPQIGSRAFADGTTANKLMYAVYDVTNADSPKLLEGLSMNSLEKAVEIPVRTTVHFNLLTDHSYRFVFWAQAPFEAGETNPYTVTMDATGANIEVDYDGLDCNNEKIDAFYATIDNQKITGDIQLDVPMYRPLAQINIGTDDVRKAQDALYVVEQSTIKTKGYTKLNLISGECDEKSQTDVEFSFANIPALSEEFPVKGYDYLAMTYILVPEDKENVDVTFDYTGKFDGQTDPLSHTRTVGSVPVQRNWRTNIYGSILTSNAELNVHIEPQPLGNHQLSELEYAAALGGSVTLQDDITIEEGDLHFFNDAIVDLNGKKITMSGDPKPVGRDQVVSNRIFVEEGANVTFKGDGIIETNGYGNAAIYVDGGTVTIEDGTYQTFGHCDAITIGQKGGTVIIKGGTFWCYYLSGTPGYESALNAIDAGLNNGGKFIVMGGTFYGFDPSNSDADKIDGKNANWVADGYKSVKSSEQLTFPGDTTNPKYSRDVYTVVPEVNTEAVVEIIDGKVYCLAPALPAGVEAEDLKDKGGVYVDANGEVKTFAATGTAIKEAMENAKEIYLAPNSQISTGSHTMKVPQTGITVYGNGATIDGGEKDFSIESFQANYSKYDKGITLDLNFYDLNGIKVWGVVTATGQTGTKDEIELPDNEKIKINLTVKNCTVKDNGEMLNSRGHNAIMNAIFDGCYMENIQLGIHHTYQGKTTIKNCEFNNVGIPINLAKKSEGKTSEVIVENCIFTNCGMDPLPKDQQTQDKIENYAAPVRVVDNAGPNNYTKLTVDGCSFNGTKGEMDILVIEYRTGKNWFPVDCTVTNCDPAEPIVWKEWSDFENN